MVLPETFLSHDEESVAEMKASYNLNNYLNRRQEKFQRTLQREASHTLRRDTLRRNKKEADIQEYDGKEDIGKLIHSWS